MFQAGQEIEWSNGLIAKVVESYDTGDFIIEYDGRFAAATLWGEDWAFCFDEEDTWRDTQEEAMADLDAYEQQLSIG